jgi:hypothetical protein
VVEHPYFAVTGPDGAFTIANVPPGSYTLSAVHPKLGVMDKSVTVTASEKVSADYSFEIKSGN